MIEKLTPEQEILKDEYFNKYLAHGIDTTQADWDKAINTIKNIYRSQDIKVPVNITQVASPLVAITLLNVYKLHENSTEVERINQRYKIDIRKDDGLKNLTEILNISCNESFHILKTLGEKEFFNTNFWGQQDSFWVSYYKFAEAIGVKNKEKDQILLDLFNDLCQSCGWLFCYENEILICNRPSKVNLNENRVLHCGSGPAMEFRDGFKIWALNGIRVTQYIVETPSEKLDVSLIATEKNVELRSEILKKIGVDRYVIKAGGKVIDKQTITTKENKKHTYELILIENLGEGTLPTPALKMWYPLSDGNDSQIPLIEWVQRGITTVLQALYFRDTGIVITPKEAEAKYKAPDVLR